MVCGSMLGPCCTDVGESVVQLSRIHKNTDSVSDLMPLGIWMVVCLVNVAKWAFAA